MQEVSQLDKAASPLPSSRQRVLCRKIRTTDAEGVINLLSRGFRKDTTRHFWVSAFRRLSEHPTPSGLPQYGYLLESGGVPVGVILLIFTSVADGNAPRIRCNVSSWYVDPEYRAFAAMLISCALKHKPATYFNVSPAPNTLAILQAQGYKQFSRGRVVAVPALSPRARGYRVETVTPQILPGDELTPFERSLLRTHAEYGCLSLICHAGHDCHPFVFALGRKRGLLCAYLIYCRSIENFVRFAGTLGRFLAWRGIPLVILDANAPIPGLIGVYSDGHPKYFNGPDQPRPGDLSYSELAMFGVPF